MADLAYLRDQEQNLVRTIGGELDAHYFMDMHPKHGPWAGALIFSQRGEPLPEEMHTDEFLDSLGPTVDYMGPLTEENALNALAHTRMLIGGLSLKSVRQAS